MKLRFSIEGRGQYQLDTNRLTFAEGKAIERATGKTFKEVGEFAKRGSLEAIQAFVFVAMKRTEPTTRFTDLDEVDLGDLKFEDDPDEPESLDEGEAGQDPPSQAAEVATP